MTKRTIVVSQISNIWINDIVEIHIESFPESTFTKVGRETVRRYYLWQFEGPHDLIAIGAFRDGTLVGYLVGGIFRGALIGFLRKNWQHLFLQVLFRPWLLLSKDLRTPILTGGKYYWSNRRSRKTTEVIEPASYKKSAGLLSIAVARKFLRRGIGKKLVSEFETIAIEKNYHELNLSVSMENRTAISFYEKLGWVIDKSKDKNYTMKKILQ